jgi:hypothetical protein
MANRHNQITNKETIDHSLEHHRLHFKENFESDSEDQDAFEDDSFVVKDVDDDTDDDVFDVCDADDENNDQDDEVDSDVCCICHGHGEMIVCDGGDCKDKSNGCDRSFHIHCIGLDFIPPGDWICETCARN